MIKEKLKNLFSNTKEKKKTENLIVLLIILVIVVIAINALFDTDENNKAINENSIDKELATNNKDSTESVEIEKRLENILSQIKGVGNVNVLITYSESSSVVPLYNEKNSRSTTEEVDTNGGTRTIESYNNDKEIINGSNSEPVTEKIVMPKIEGAIITAEGAGNSQIRSNIISAVEAVTGVATHKIQVFEMK